MIDLGGEAGNVHGVSGAAYRPSEPALPLAPFNPLYQIVIPLHWHQLFLDCVPPPLCATVCSLPIFTSLYVMRHTFIRSKAEPKFSFHDFA